MLDEARALGFLGPGPIEAHLEHAAGFSAVLRGAVPAVGAGAAPVLAADLGSGGGVPGLPLAVQFARWRWILVESARRRAAFLRAAVAALQLSERVEVVEARAEEVGRSPHYRGQCQVAVARGFGPPAVVAECAAPLLLPGGHLVVSEPPGGAQARWPDDGLGRLGMRAGPAVQASGASYQVLLQQDLCPSRYPRRVGVPAKRPLF